MEKINWYPGHMAKTKRLIKEKINLIDVVYELIDARIPYSSKIKDVDSLLKDKPRVLIITKKDLCDKKETDKWIKYYISKDYNVIELDLNKDNLDKLVTLTESLVIKQNEKRIAKGMTTRKIRVLVMGVPNVGKSTLINRLSGKTVARVENKPGVTKELNWLRVNDKLELLDTPGILYPNITEPTVGLNLATFTAIKENILPLYDISSYILKTLELHYPMILQDRFKIDHLDEDIIKSFDLIGKNRGCILKGNEIDYDRVMNLILNEIKSGVIKNITFDRYKNE